MDKFCLPHISSWEALVSETSSVSLSAPRLSNGYGTVGVGGECRGSWYGAGIPYDKAIPEFISEFSLGGPSCWYTFGRNPYCGGESKQLFELTRSSELFLSRYWDEKKSMQPLDIDGLSRVNQR